MNAEALRDLLLKSEPRLDHPDITLDILCGLPLPDREIDIIMLYHDSRDEHLQLKTTQGTPIHSFVLIIEVKQHSPDLIRFKGQRLLVRYAQRWHDATAQCEAQTWALKRYQEASYQGKKRRSSALIQRAIWLARAPIHAFDQHPAVSGIPVHFSDLDWNELVSKFKVNGYFKSIRTLVDTPSHPTSHSLASLRDLLTYEANPTRLDIRRVNALTQTRFDAEKTAYIQNLGEGLLLLRGRGGTGKTFALVQMALHLARQGKRTVILTYNHGLIADINRSLRFIGASSPDIKPLPVLKTRYKFAQEILIQNLGEDREIDIKKISDLDGREAARFSALLKHNDPLEHNYDYVLVDEGQDWEDQHRDLMYRIFSPGRVIVADGVDQFVGQARCKWDVDGIEINRRHSLRASRRTKAATCQTISVIARSLGLSDWDLEPDPNTHGGRFTVLVEPNAVQAVSLGLKIIDTDQRKDSEVKAVDSLVCLPSVKAARGINYEAIFDKEIEATERDSWRGFDEKDRRYYPKREGQLRAVRYHSCRGMEGWTTLCLGLDQFFQFQLDNPHIDVDAVETSLKARDGLFLLSNNIKDEIAGRARKYAINWLMIPLTRSIDHLIIHIKDEQSELGKVLADVSKRFPGSIEWVRTEDIKQSASK